MIETARYAGHPEGTTRLRYHEGHLGAAVTMIESGKTDHALALQCQAIVRAVANHMDHCLDTKGADQGRAESTAIIRYR